jgi:hypothetical protein
MSLEAASGRNSFVDRLWISYIVADLLGGSADEQPPPGDYLHVPVPQALLAAGAGVLEVVYIRDPPLHDIGFRIGFDEGQRLVIADVK